MQTQAAWVLHPTGICSLYGEHSFFGCRQTFQNHPLPPVPSFPAMGWSAEVELEKAQKHLVQSQRDCTGLRRQLEDSRALNRRVADDRLSGEPYSYSCHFCCDRPGDKPCMQIPLHAEDYDDQFILTDDVLDHMM